MSKAKVYKREYAGIEAFVIKTGTIFLVTKGDSLEYSTSAALTHKEAVKDAVCFWKKKGLI